MYDSEEEAIDPAFVVRGLPMTRASYIIAALVFRLGGKVELTKTELEVAEGVLMVKSENDGLIIEANTDPIHGALDASIIE